MRTTAIRGALAALALSALGMMGCNGGSSNNSGGAGGAGAQGGEGGAGAQGGAGQGGAQGGAGQGGAQGGAGQGGAQGGAGGAAGGDVCDAQDAKGNGDCKLLFGVAWDGQSCVEISGCECLGADCDALYSSVDACKAAHSGCAAAGPCDAEDAAGVGNCDAFFGYAWNGKECIGISGCSCEGTACAGLSMDLAVCKQKHADCGGMSGVCDPQKAEGVGACAAIIGYKWDGMTCVALSGCDCEGPSCADLFDTAEACKAKYGGCAPSANCVPQEAKGQGACALFFGYAWNGMTCAGISGCSCVGSDCANLFDSPEVCAEKYATCQ